MGEAPPPVMLITGAARGIGAATTRAAHRSGYRLVLVGRSESVADFSETFPPGSTTSVIGDSTDPATVSAAVESALSTFGRLDAVVANAGIAVGPSICGDLDGPDPTQAWTDMILTNVLGTVLTVRATVPALTTSRGRLIIIGSVLGRYSMPGSLYSATKYATFGIAEAARQELLGTGVSVTLIEPGPVATSFGGNGDTDRSDTTLTPGDVAAAVLYSLAQPAGVDINELLLRPHGATP